MEKRHKILWISHVIPYPPKGGVLIRSHHLLTELAKRHDVDLFAFNQPKFLRSYFSSEQEGLREAESYLKMFVGKLHIEAIPAERSKLRKLLLVFASMFTISPYTINWLRSKSARRILSTNFKLSEYDVIHFDTVSLVPYAEGMVKTNLVLDHHNVESHMMLRRAEKEESFLRKFYYYWEARKLVNFEKRCLSKFNMHLVCSEADASRLNELVNGLNIKIIPNGVDIPKLPSDLNRAPNTAPRLLFIGGLDWYPNADAMEFFVRQIWPSIRSVVAGVELDIVGKNPSQTLKELADLDEHVHLHGFVEDIEPFYAACTVYVCPIRDGGGTKLKILDALAHAVPIVAHPLACEGIDVMHGTHVMLAEDPDAFSEAVVNLLRERVLGAELGLRGRELIAAHYASQNIGIQLANEFTKLVEQEAKQEA
jgi:polysaccharide biosynthesis protein PslH